MQKFIPKPETEAYNGIRVTKDTSLTFENEFVKQTLEGLVLISESTTHGNNYDSTTKTRVYLAEGDVLIFEPEKRGYIYPTYPFVTVEEAIAELECVLETMKE